MLCILLTPYEIITISKNDAIETITPHDIIIVQNLIFSSESLRQTESLIPICLPGISDAGYLQIYTNFIQPEIGLIFVTESQEHAIFLQFSEQSNNIRTLMEKENLIEYIKIAIQHREKSIISHTIDNNIKYEDTEKLLDELYLKLTQTRLRSSSKDSSSTGLTISPIPTSNNNSFGDPFDESKFLICKNRNSGQMFTFRFSNFDRIKHEEKVVLKNYCQLYDIYNSQNLSINGNNFFHYEKNDNFTHVIQVNETYIIFISFNFFKEFDEINHLTNEILKIIKFKEAYFFINKY